MLFYNLIFFTVIFILFAINAGFIVAMEFGKKIELSAQKYIVVALSIVLFLITAFRSNEVGADTSMYSHLATNSNVFDLYTTEFITYGLLNLLNLLGKPGLLIPIFSFLYIRNLTVFVLNKREKRNLLLLFFLFWTSFFIQSLAINVIRQGVAVSFLLLALSSYYNKNNLKAILYCIIAIGFHKSATIPIIVFFLTAILPIWSSILLYFVCIIVSVKGFGILDIASKFIGSNISGEAQVYLTFQDQSYQVGFRPQFVLFNTFFLIAFSILYFFRVNLGNDIKYYSRLLKMYIINSCIFFLMFQLPFSDRWGINAWVLIPVLLMPFLKEHDRYKVIFTCSILIFQTLVFLFFTLTQK